MSTNEQQNATKIATSDETRGVGLDLAVAAVGGLASGAGAVLTQQALNVLGSKPKSDKK